MPTGLSYDLGRQHPLLLGAERRGGGGRVCSRAALDCRGAAHLAMTVESGQNKLPLVLKPIPVGSGLVQRCFSAPGGSKPCRDAEALRWRILLTGTK